MRVRPDHRAAIETVLRSRSILPATVDRRARRRTPERDQIVISLDHAGPVLELAGRQRAQTERDRLAFAPDLPLWPVQDHFKVVVAEQQLDLELVAAVRGIALEGYQLAVAV